MSNYILANDLYSYGLENLRGQFDAVIISILGPVVGFSLQGHIFFDELERFDDNEKVHTSSVLEVLPLTKAYYLVKTKNSTYLCLTKGRSL